MRLYRTFLLFTCLLGNACDDSSPSSGVDGSGQDQNHLDGSISFDQENLDEQPRLPDEGHSPDQRDSQSLDLSLDRMLEDMVRDERPPPLDLAFDQRLDIAAMLDIPIQEDQGASQDQSISSDQLELDSALSDRLELDNTLSDRLGLDSAPLDPLRFEGELGRAQRGVAFEFEALPAGGEGPYRCHAEELPPGLSLDPLRCVISGVPEGEGDVNFTLLLQDSRGEELRLPFELEIAAAALSLERDQLPAAQSGLPYEVQLQAGGGEAPYRFEALSLPDGLSLSAEGLLSGIPESEGILEVQIRLSDAGGQILEQDLQLRILPLGLYLITDTLPPAELGQGYRFSLEGLGLAPLRWWAEGLPPGFLLHPLRGILSGSPQEYGSYNITFHLSDIQGEQVEAQLILEVRPTSLNIATDRLPDGRVGVALQGVTLQVGSGVPSFRWTVAGLPQGLTYDPETGALEGTPEEAGLFHLQVQLSDAAEQSTEQGLPLFIRPAALSILTEILPEALIAQPYQFQLAAQGGTAPLRWSAEGLPPGVVLDSSGRFSGQIESLGTWWIDVQLSDTDAQQATRLFSLRAQAPQLELSFAQELPEGELNQPYPPQQLEMEGGAEPFLWRALGLPAGISWDPELAQLSGTPQESGSFTFSLSVEDAAGQQGRISGVLEIRSGPLMIVTENLPEAATDVEYLTRLEGAGGQLPYRWSISELPQGLQLEGDQLRGRQEEAGLFKMLLRIEDASGAREELELPLRVERSPLRLLTEAFPVARTGYEYDLQAEAQGGDRPYAWALEVHPALGVQIDAETGRCGGRARGLMGINAYPATLRLTDSGGESLSLEGSINLEVAELIFELEALPDGYLQAEYQFQLPVLGGAPPYQWSASGLPQGLLITRDEGIIQGEPTRISALRATLSVSDTRNQRIERQLPIRIWGARIEIDQEGLPEGRLIQEYRALLSAQGGSPPYRWFAEGLPEGLEMRSREAEIYGHPQETGAYEINISVEDSEGQIYAQLYLLEIYDRALTFQMVEYPAARVDEAYDLQVQVAGGRLPYAWRAEGLPPGLLIEEESGRIWGSPTQRGRFNTTLFVETADGQQAGDEFEFLVEAKRLLLTLRDLPPAREGEPYHYRIEMEGGIAPLSYGAQGLPDGMNLNPETGQIDGSPEGYGEIFVDLWVESGDGQRVEQRFLLSITPPRLEGFEGAELPEGRIHEEYRNRPEVSGGVPPYQYAAEGLPPGLSLDPETGWLMGTPISYGHYEPFLLVRDAEGQETGAALSLVIQPPLLTLLIPELPSARQGSFYELSLEVTGGAPPLHWNAEGLPPGLSLVGGLLSGTPSQIGEFQPQLQVMDSWGNLAERGLELLVRPPRLEISLEPLPPARVQEPYLGALEAAGGLPPYTWSLDGLPDTLSLDEETGLIEGRPDEYGLLPIEISLSDAWGQRDSLEGSFRIWPERLILELERLPDGVTWEFYEAQLEAQGGVPPYRWSALLPRGLEIDPITGRISGVPIDHGDLQPLLILEDAEEQRLERPVELFIEYHCVISNGGVEACDRLDNDCDDQVDEGFDLQSDAEHCGACERRCDFSAARAHCEMGRCLLDACEAGAHDLDGELENGCEYRCLSNGEEVCDEQDNDCDGEIDEGFDLQNALQHCGACDDSCEREGSEMECRGGRCHLLACLPDYYDLDQQLENGCEYACVISEGGVEECDHIDNDCDGAIDESLRCSERIRPVVSLHLSIDLIEPGEEIQLWFEAEDNFEVVERWVESRGEEIPLAPQGPTSFRPEGTGEFVITAYAEDQAGNIGQHSRSLFVFDPNDVTPPTVWIRSPEQDTLIDSPIIFEGEVADENLAWWSLSYSPKYSDEWVSLLEGNEPLDGVIGEVHPSQMLPGFYDIALIAEDANGRRIQHQRPYEVAVTPDIGNFRITFTDLHIPVAGLPITIQRIYDSRKKVSDDFGAGWSLSLKQGQYENNRPNGDGWDVVQGGGFFKWPCGNSGELADHFTTVRVSDVEHYRFRTEVQPTAPVPLTGNICQVVTTFDYIDGSLPGLATLSVLGSSLAVYQPGRDYLSVDIDRLEEVYEVGAVRLTTPDGRVFDITMEGGTQRMGEPNGNELTIGYDGVRHSSGKEIAFQRDEEGRIISITDPKGELIRYSYDEAGDLIEHIDQAGNNSGYRYNNTHHLLEIIDPEGHSLSRQEFNDEGKLIAVIDANGERMEIDPNIADNTEVLTLPSGAVETIIYDERGNELRRIDPEGRIWERSYDEDDNLLSRTDPEGNMVRMEYDGLGRKIREIDAEGNVQEWSYDERNKPTLEMDSNGNTTQKSYDEFGAILSETDPLGNITRYSYDEDTGLRTSKTEANGGVWRYGWDREGNKTSETDPLGNITHYTYDANNNKISKMVSVMVDGELMELETHYTYDAMNRITQTEHPDGSRSGVEFNSRGLKIAEFNRNGEYTHYEYDQVGRLIATHYPDGSSYRAEFDSDGRPTLVTDESGRSYRREFDEMGRARRSELPDGSSFEREFGSQGEVVSVSNSMGNSHSYQFDARGKRLSTTTMSGGVIRWERDANGNATQISSADGIVTQLEYDAMNRQTAQIIGGLIRTEQSYDAMGKIASRSDPMGGVTRYEYDLNGELIQVTDALGQITQLERDGRGKIITLTDARGNTSRFEYDELGRRIATLLPTGEEERLFYDSEGRLTRKIDFASRTTSYHYDERGRLTLSSLPNGEQVRRTYTPTGRLETFQDSRGLTRWEYDQMDRILVRVDPDGSEIAFEYNRQGQRTAVITELGRLEYTHNEMGLINTVRDLNGGITRYRYNEAGVLISRELPNQIRMEFEYDQFRRREWVRIIDGAAGDQLLASYHYEFDLRSLRSAIEEQPSGRRISYEYDLLGQLIQERISAPQEEERIINYAYDEVGNRILKDDSLEGETRYDYDASDRMISEGDFAWSFDENGNIQQEELGGAQIRYTFDSQNRMISVEKEGQLFEFEYDAHGQMVEKWIDGELESRFLMDDKDPFSNVSERILRLNATGESELDIRGYRLISRFIDNNPRYYIQDGLDSNRLIFNDDGEQIASFDYDAFGQLLVESGPGLERSLFRDQHYDRDLSLYYLRARWMKPSHGRFVSRDPVDPIFSIPLTINRYIYAGNDPNNNIDPKGESFGMAALSMGLNVLGGLATVAVGFGAGFMTNNIRRIWYLWGNPDWDNSVKLCARNSAVFLDDDIILSHYFLVTSTRIAGAGGGFPMVMTPHSQDDVDVASCWSVPPTVSESCVNGMLDGGFDYGYWAPGFNYCLTAVMEILYACDSAVSDY